MSAEVYRVYDKAGRLLYVGQSVKVDARLAYHAQNAPWWPFRDRIERVEYDSSHEAEQAEAHAIVTEHPRWNIEGRSVDHPDGWASTSQGAKWLAYEREVSRRLRRLESERHRLLREWEKLQVALRAARVEAEMISTGQLDTNLEDIEAAS